MNCLKRSVAISVVIIFTLIPALALGDCSDVLEGLIGYTVIVNKTIDRWHDDDESGDGFRGCQHGRVIVFTDGTYLTCSEYSYTYSYRPMATIFAKDIAYKGKQYMDFKMLVDGEVFDMRK